MTQSSYLVCSEDLCMKYIVSPFPVWNCSNDNFSLVTPLVSGAIYKNIVFLSEKGFHRFTEYRWFELKVLSASVYLSPVSKISKGLVKVKTT